MTTPRVLIDAELLVLLVVGLFDPAQVTRHPNLGGRKAGYTATDFDLLSEWLAETEWVVTPNVMTEASNLLRQIGPPLRDDLTLQLRHVAAIATERYAASAVAALRPEFLWFGLADAATLAALDAETVLLTADGALYAAAASAGCSAVQFAHLRAART